MPATTIEIGCAIVDVTDGTLWDNRATKQKKAKLDVLMAALARRHRLPSQEEYGLMHNAAFGDMQNQ